MFVEIIVPSLQVATVPSLAQKLLHGERERGGGRGGRRGRKGREESGERKSERKRKGERGRARKGSYSGGSGLIEEECMQPTQLAHIKVNSALAINFTLSSEE